MPDKGTVVEVRLVDASGWDVRLPGVIVEESAGRVVVELVDAPELPSIEKVELRHREASEFVRRTGSLEPAAAPDSSPRVLRVRVLDTASEKESRQSLRLPVRRGVVAATLGRSTTCDILDFSPNGFAGETSQRLTPGQVSSVRVTFREESEKGTASVKYCRPIAGGRFRAGISVPRDEMRMRTFLERITAQLQSERLAELAAIRARVLGG